MLGLLIRKIFWYLETRTGVVHDVTDRRTDWRTDRTAFSNNVLQNQWPRMTLNGVTTAYYVWVPSGFFPGVGHEGTEGRWSPQGVQGQSPSEDVGAKPLECDGLHFRKIMHKYFVYWDFRQHLQHKNTLQHFQGQVSPLPLAHACGCPWCFLCCSWACFLHHIRTICITIDLT